MRVGIYTVDARWRTERVIVEVDGGDGHASYARMQRDRGVTSPCGEPATPCSATPGGR
jgi:very-short-patch-repair endonuclease